MKTKNLIPIIIGIVTGTLISSCERSSHQKAEDRIEHNSGVDDHGTDIRTPAPVPTDRTTVNEPMVQNDKDVQQFREEARVRINENEKAIADFRKKMKNENAKYRSKYEKQTENLEEKNWRMKKRVDEYKHEGNEGWQKFKREFNHDMDELGKSLKDLGKDNVK
jgi:hypothetical protein